MHRLRVDLGHIARFHVQISLKIGDQKQQLH